MSRLQGVDVLRVAAIIAVISIHTVPFAGSSSPIGVAFDLPTALNEAARFAVPFFFILSGYFWAQKATGAHGVYEPTVKMARRIAFLLLAWSVVYLLPTNIFESLATGPIGPLKQIYWSVSNVLNRPFETAMQGTKSHLWFLPGLLCSLAISAVFLRYGRETLLAAAAVVLYLTGLAGKAYSDTPLGFHSDFNFRNGPFFSLIFFVTGYFLHRRKPSPSWLPAGLLVAGLGLLLQFAELEILNRKWGTTMVQDCVVGTYLYGLGIAMVALSNPRFLHLPRAAAIGPLVLGIYTSHFIFVDLLKPLDSKFSGNWMWSVSYIAAVFLLSWMLVRVMSRFELSRKLVV